MTFLSLQTLGLCLLPFITALVGWGTNTIAIKMLFHPKKPVRIFWVRLQGIFPKRQSALAERLGEVVATELFSIGDLRSHLESPDLREHIMGIVGRRAGRLIDEKLAEHMPILSMFVSGDMRNNIRLAVLAEIEASLPELTQAVLQNLEENLDIKRVVSEKVRYFSTEKIEAMLKGIMRREFKFVEWIGGFLGFLVGLIQVIFYLLLA